MLWWCVVRCVVVVLSLSSKVSSWSRNCTHSLNSSTLGPAKHLKKMKNLKYSKENILTKFDPTDQSAFEVRHTDKELDKPAESQKKRQHAEWVGRAYHIGLGRMPRRGYFNVIDPLTH